MRALKPALAALFLAPLLCAVVPASAQIVVVPLEPTNPGDVLPAEPPTGGGFYDPNAILQQVDPNEGWVPLPDPLNPGEVLPANPFDPDATYPGDPLGTGNEIGLETLAPGSVVGQDVTTVAEDLVTSATGARLKGLDKLAGTVEELTVQTGETVGLGWLQITLGDCRYPVDNPSGDAYAWLVIREAAGEAPVFEGWMIASSPGLNALDHARFDVWVLGCTTPATTAEAGDETTEGTEPTE